MKNKLKNKNMLFNILVITIVIFSGLSKNIYGTVFDESARLMQNGFEVFSSLFNSTKNANNLGYQTSSFENAFFSMFEKPIKTLLLLFIICIFFGFVINKFITHIKKVKYIKDKEIITDLPDIKNTEDTSISLKNRTNYYTPIIQKHDPEFSSTIFLDYAKDIFNQVLNAFYKREYLNLSSFETDKLYSRHKHEIETLKITNKINKIENIKVKFCDIYDYKVTNKNEIIHVNLLATMKNYIIDERNNKLIQGSPDDIVTLKYKMSFIRKHGLKSLKNMSDLYIRKCPNCDGENNVTKTSNCIYCSSKIVGSECGFTLFEIRKFK